MPRKYGVRPAKPLVEKIVDKKKVRSVVHYKVHWKGLGADRETWEPESDLTCQELIEEYENNLATKEKQATKDNVVKKTAKGVTMDSRKRNKVKGSNSKQEVEEQPVEQKKSEEETGDVSAPPVSSTKAKKSETKDTQKKKAVLEKPAQVPHTRSRRRGVTQPESDAVPPNAQAENKSKPKGKRSKKMENDSKSNEGPKKEADGEENNTKLNNRAKNSRKRKRSNVEEETSELEPPPKRKRNTRATAADQKKNEQEQVDETQGVESSMLTQDKVAKAKKIWIEKICASIL